MSMQQLGPIDVTCDAPPYPIVRACHLIEFDRPEDVRWLRASHYLDSLRNPWKTILTLQDGAGAPCSCGTRLPILEKYQFFFASGNQTYYLLGQCKGCGTVYWDESSER